MPWFKGGGEILIVCHDPPSSACNSGKLKLIFIKLSSFVFTIQELIV